MKLTKKLTAFIVTLALTLGFAWGTGVNFSDHSDHTSANAAESNVYILDMNDVEGLPATGSNILDGKYGTDDYFSISSMGKIGANEVMLSGVDSAAISRTRFQVGGASAGGVSSGAWKTDGAAFTSRTISFTTTTAATVEIWYASSGTADTKAGLFKGTPSSYGTGVFSDGTVRVGITTIAAQPHTITTQGDYFFAFTANANVFYVKVIETPVPTSETFELDMNTEEGLSASGSNILDGKYGTDDYFTISSMGKIGANEVMLSGIDSAAISRTRFQVGGASAGGVSSGAWKTDGAAFTSRTISFTTTAAATVEIWYASSGTADTKAGLFKGTPSSYGTGVFSDGTARVNITTIAAQPHTITTQGDYFFAFTANANVFYIKVVETYSDTVVHTFSEWNQTIAPDCVEKGSHERYCITCFSNITDAKAASEEDIEKCTIGAYAVEDVAALGHKWGAWEEVTAVSYTQDGEDERFCERPDCVYGEGGEPAHETRVIPMLQLCKTVVDSQYMDLIASGSAPTVTNEDIGGGFFYTGSFYADAEGARILANAGTAGADIEYTAARRFRQNGKSALKAGEPVTTTDLTLANQETTIPNFNIFTFEASESAQLFVWALGGGASNTNRAVVLYKLEDGDGNPDAKFIAAKAVQATTTTANGEKIAAVSFTITEDGKYAIASGYGPEHTGATGQLNFYRLSLENHTFGAWANTITPTCDTPGQAKRICSVCEKEESKAVAELSQTGEHTWTEVKDSSKTCPDAKKNVCSVCDAAGAAIVHKHTVTLKYGTTTLTGGGEVNCGSAFTKPADPTEEGYTFAGWFTDEACTQSYTFTTAVEANRTLYAKFTANTPDDGNNGTDETKPGCMSAAISYGNLGVVILAAAAFVAVIGMKRKRRA